MSQKFLIVIAVACLFAGLAAVTLCLTELVPMQRRSGVFMVGAIIGLYGFAKLADSKDSISNTDQ